MALLHNDCTDHLVAEPLSESTHSEIISVTNAHASDARSNRTLVLCVLSELSVRAAFRCIVYDGR